ncbi:MAG: lipase family protein [Planctomycetota bacterium]
MRKELPRDLSYEALAKERLDYAYFEGADDFPFETANTEFSPVNNWWMAEISLLAYVTDQNFVREKLARAGLLEVFFLERESTHGFVAAGADATIVAFRGTDDATDVLSDLRALLTPEGEGHVHQGFQDALNLVWTEFAALMGQRDCWFTGHSLGAALATVAAVRHHRRVRALYTYGSPRVGDADLVASCDFPAYRVVNNNDLVTRLPPPVKYRHVGELKYFDSDRKLRDDPELWDRVAEQVTGHASRIAENVRRWLDGDFKSIPIDSLVDHAPIHYAIHAWNHLVESRA